MLTGNGASCYTPEERLFSAVMIMVGGFVQAIVVGSITTIVTNFDEAAARLRSESALVLGTARYLELSETIVDRVADYYQFMEV